MAFIFPSDKSDFTAPNGITYSWDDVDSKWRVRSFRGAGGAAGVILSETPPADPSPGDLWFDTSEIDLTMYVYTGAEWVPAAPPVSLDGLESAQQLLEQRVTDGETTQAEIQAEILALQGLIGDGGSIDDSLYMKLSGNQQLDKDTTFRIRQNDLSDGSNTFISINDGEMNLYHLAYPNGDAHAANQKYVDDEVAKHLPLAGGTLSGELNLGSNKIIQLATPTADTDSATKLYVDEQVRDSSAGPAPCRWKWEWVGKSLDIAGDTLTTGQFAGPQLGNGNASSGLLYYFNRTPLNSNYKIYCRGYDDEITFTDSTGGPLLSVWSDPVFNDTTDLKLMCIQRVKKYKHHQSNYEPDGGFIEIETHEGMAYAGSFAGTGLFYNSPYYVQLSGVF